MQDLVIIGSGFSGLVAAKKAHQQQLNFSWVSQDSGATQHFSGAFDFIDPSWQNPNTDPAVSDLQTHLKNFSQAHPTHLLSRLLNSHGSLVESFGPRALDFFDFYGIPVLGDGKDAVFAFGSSGRKKYSAFTLKSMGLTAAEMQQKKAEKVLWLDIPTLPQFSSFAIAQELKNDFADVTVCSYPLPTHAHSPLVGLLKSFEEPSAWHHLVAFLKAKIAGHGLVFLPPILGIKNFALAHAFLEKELGVRVVELLAVLPSAAGLRLQHLISQALCTKNIQHDHASVVGHTVKNRRISAVTVQDSQKQQRELSAEHYILATGKFLGGGLRRHRNFTESVFDLPLSLNSQPLADDALLSEFVHPQAIHKQPFENIGVFVNQSFHPCRQNNIIFDNLKVCGHILTGFHFTRDKCGFAVSFLTAEALF